MLIINSVGLLATLLLGSPQQVTIFALTALLSTLNVFFLLALIASKRWGFYGFAFVGVIGLLFNVSLGTGGMQAFVSFLSVPLLYFILKLGSRPAWRLLN
jgi:hypothetical protein